MSAIPAFDLSFAAPGFAPVVAPACQALLVLWQHHLYLTVAGPPYSSLFLLLQGGFAFPGAWMKPAGWRSVSWLIAHRPGWPPFSAKHNPRIHLLPVRDHVDCPGLKWYVRSGDVPPRVSAH